MSNWRKNGPNLDLQVHMDWKAKSQNGFNPYQWNSFCSLVTKYLWRISFLSLWSQFEQYRRDLLTTSTSTLGISTMVLFSFADVGIFLFNIISVLILGMCTNFATWLLTRTGDGGGFSGDLFCCNPSSYLRGSLLQFIGEWNGLGICSLFQDKSIFNGSTSPWKRSMKTKASML